MGRNPNFREQIKSNKFPYIEKSNYKINENNIFELRTGKNHIIRILLECIKYIIYETNIIFYPHQKENIITISNKDKNENVIIYIKLLCSEFEHYFCDEKCVVGVNIMDLFKVIKTVDKEDILFIYMEKNNNDILYVSTENCKTKEITKTSILTKDYENERIEIEEIEYNMILSMPSLKFHKICKDFNTFKTQYLRFKVINQQILLSALKGEVNRHVIYHSPDSDHKPVEKNIVLKKQNDFEFDNVYILPYIFNFTKATPLSERVTFYLSNTNPLIIEYQIVNNGTLSFLINHVDDELIEDK